VNHVFCAEKTCISIKNLEKAQAGKNPETTMFLK